jgi:hypothetical protein
MYCWEERTERDEACGAAARGCHIGPGWIVDWPGIFWDVGTEPDQDRIRPETPRRSPMAGPLG